MSWRTGAELFAEFWPLVRTKVRQANLRRDFVRDLLAVFLEYDVDPHDLADLDDEVARALDHLARESEAAD